MGWDFIEKHGRGTRKYGSLWDQVPCVSIGKTCIAFNEQFIGAFGVKLGMSARIAINSETRKIGIKIVSDSEEVALGFAIQRTKSTSAAKKSALIGMSIIGKRFPDCIGHAYRAHLNPNERIIEVLLSPGNMV